jgi:hypothetical protein
MRYIILVFCLILYLTPHAQVKIGPSIGLNQSYVSAAKNGIFFRVVNEFKPNLSLGIKVEWTINEKNFLVSSIAYNRKEMEAYDRGFIPLTSINFNSINSSLIFNHKIYSGIRFGGGLNYTFIPKINRIRTIDIANTYFKGKHDFGLITSLNYNYKNFILDFNYSYSFATNKFNKDNLKQMLEPISFIRLEFAYLFSVKTPSQ